MRLLHAKKLDLKTFEGDDDRPRYAILSHCWEVDEVTYPNLPDKAKSQAAGHRKIIEACRQAVAGELDWMWADTCCIDKSSSAELSEAINSMFAWYRGAEICYVYLADVSSTADDWRAAFKRSRWHTRGWTLQELLAPRVLTFFDRDWNRVGSQAELIPLITERTGIQAKDFDGYQKASTARKMAWAANRATRRVEDRAYSLLGLFDINMPLLYGEGLKAFQRFQLEVFQQSGDESLFAWSGEGDNVLAPSPESFIGFEDVEEIRFFRRRSIQLSRNELKLTTPLYACNHPDTLMVLNCARKGHFWPLTIVMENLSSDLFRRRGIFEGLGDCRCKTSSCQHSKLDIFKRVEEWARNQCPIIFQGSRTPGALRKRDHPTNPMLLK